MITMKAPQQAGLTGLKGGIVRKVAVERRGLRWKRPGQYKGETRAQANNGITRMNMASQTAAPECAADQLLSLVWPRERRRSLNFAFSILFAYLINSIGNCSVIRCFSRIEGDCIRGSYLGAPGRWGSRFHGLTRNLRSGRALVKEWPTIEKFQHVVRPGTGMAGMRRSPSREKAFQQRGKISGLWES